MPTGRCEKYYRWKVENLNEDTNELITTYYREAKEIASKLNIPRCTIYNIINKGDTLNHKVKKHETMFITKIKDNSKPAFQRVMLDYN